MRIILLTIFGTLFFLELYKTAESSFFTDGLALLIIGLIGAILLIWTIWKDFNEYERTKMLASYFSTFIGLFFILANIWLFYFQESRKNSPTLISGFYDGGFNGFSVDFKKNGKYIMANGSGLGESYYYGKYSLKDTIITIDQSSIDNSIKSNKFVIRTEEYYLPLDTISKFTRNQANYITQIDSNGIEIDKEFRFRVTSDNRNKFNK